jgi:hypothetical protein
MTTKGKEEEEENKHVTGGTRTYRWLLATLASRIFFSQPPESQVAAVISQEKHLKTFEWDLELETQKSFIKRTPFGQLRIMAWRCNSTCGVMSQQHLPFLPRLLYARVTGHKPTATTGEQYILLRTILKRSLVQTAYWRFSAPPALETSRNEPILQVVTKNRM